MNNQQIGREVRERGDDFEDMIEATFGPYAHAGLAYLEFMPVPTRMVKPPLRVATGKAPFDVWGFAPTRLSKIRAVTKPEVAAAGKAQHVVERVGATFAIVVGAELKATSKHEPSLRIVADKKHGSGISAPQLRSLAHLAKHGGIARVVWSNGGEIGVLTSEKIVAAHTIYETSVESEARGATPPAGTRSIPWSLFERVDYGHVAGAVVVHWLKGLDDGNA